MGYAVIYIGHYGFEEAEIVVMTDGALNELGSDTWPTRENIVRSSSLQLFRSV